jgi:hypothetical protein
MAKGRIAGILAVLVLLLGVQAAAQILTPEQMGLNYSVSAGVGLMANSIFDTNSVPSIGFGWYDTAGSVFGNNAAFGLTADWMLVKRNNGEDVNLVPLLFNYRQYGAISSYRVFATLGVGILATTDSIPEMGLEDGANLGWTVGVGLDITNNLFFQGRFIAGSDPGDDGVTSLQLGYRL